MEEDLETRLYSHHERCERFLEEGDIPSALTEARLGLAIATEHRQAFPLEVVVETHLLLANALVEADAPGEALEICEEAARLDPQETEVLLARGITLVHLVRFEEARRDLEAYVADGDFVADALWHLGVLAEFRNEMGEADRLFREAKELDPEALTLPVRLSAERLQGLLSEVIEDLPAELRRALDAVVIEIDTLPSPEVLLSERPPLSPFLLGLYLGTPHGEKSVLDQPRDVDRIMIFQRNIERIAGDLGGLHEQLLITLHHEIGHHLGWDEDDLAERGLD